MTDPIIARVHKLLKLSQNNNSPAEAAAAGAAAQRLIDQHNLSEAMLSLDSTAQAAPDEPVTHFGDPAMALGGTGRWNSWLAQVVCKANACKPYASGGRVFLIGRPSDVETVRYLHAYLAGEVTRLANQYRGSGTTWLNNYRLGAVSAISDTFAAQHKAFEAEARAQATPGALVLVNQGLAKVAQRMATVEAWQRANFKLHKRGGGRSTYDSNARAQGKRDGATISINASRGSLVTGRALGGRA